MAGREEAVVTPRWDEQFEARHDFPSTPATALFALCTTPRSGSHFLGHLMHREAAFGYPLEYFNPRNLERWAELARAAGATDVLTFVKSVRTSPNGAFGVKLHHSHLAAFLTHEDPEILSQYRFVRLRRTDLVAQAVSFAWASQTKAWISDLPEKGPAEYRYDLIAAKLDQIVFENAAWEAFLAARGYEPLAITFEQVRGDPGAAMRQIAEFVGVQPGDGATNAFMPETQTSQSKNDWAERFRAETSTRARAGLVTPGDGSRLHDSNSRLTRSLAPLRRAWTR